jgi:hypothetical protein
VTRLGICRIASHEAPFDPVLHKQAEAAAGHIDMKAVSDEYSRLILLQYHRPQAKVSLAGLFGKPKD